MNAEPLPDCYAELHTTRYLDLGKLRNSISDECTVAIAYQDEEYVKVLTQADDDVRVRIPAKADTDSENNRTPIPIQIGQLSERSDARVLAIKNCPK